ncbi:hypothetical protein [Cyclobacterium amurskyense]|nr:hypothetical protein [Cyclobacterium amurskyense]
MKSKNNEKTILHSKPNSKHHFNVPLKFTLNISAISELHLD